MKIDVNGLLGLLVLASTVLGGWIVYVKNLKPDSKDKDKCVELQKKIDELQANVEDLEERDRKKDAQIKFNRDKINYMIRRLKEKSSFNN